MARAHLNSTYDIISRVEEYSAFRPHGIPSIKLYRVSGPLLLVDLYKSDLNSLKVMHNYLLIIFFI